jgi:hypothetical protein
MELLTIIVIIAILIAISYPLLSSHKPELLAKAGARQIGALFQKARIRSANLNRPIRVVINCSKPSQKDQCFMDLQSAVVKETEVSDWERMPGDHELLDQNLLVVKKDPNALKDGQLSFKDIFWVIFMPTGRVFSDPNPLDLFLYHKNQKKELKNGWSLTVDKETGRVGQNRIEAQIQ